MKNVLTLCHTWDSNLQYSDPQSMGRVHSTPCGDLLDGGWSEGCVQNVLPCLVCVEGGGGAQQVSDPRFSHFVAPTPCN